MKKTLSINMVNEKKTLVSVRGYNLDGNTYTMKVYREIHVPAVVFEKIVKAFVLDGVENTISITERFDNGTYQILSLDSAYLGCMSGRDFVITDEYEL